MTGSADPDTGLGAAQGTRSAVRTLTGPTALTLLLTLTLASLGTALAVSVPTQPLLPVLGGRGLVVAAIALAIAFLATELAPALVEVRNQAYSFSLAGVPLLLGLLYLPPALLLAIRLSTTVAVFSVQRPSPLKFAYNIAGYLLDTALVLVLAHWLISPQRELDLQMAALCYLALAVVDVIMSLLVLVVIRINQGPMTLHEAAEVLVPASLFVILNTAIGLTTALLLTHSALGFVLVATFLAATTGGYRAYVVLRARHTSLQVVQDFIHHGESAATVRDLSEGSLRQIQVLLRATSVELDLEPVEQEGAEPVRLTVHADGETSQTRVPNQSADRVLVRALRSDNAALLTDTSTDPDVRAWLTERGVHDALVVAIDQRDARGRVVVLDRQGDTTRFTLDDLGLLTTLVGHLAVALQSRRLVERLQYEATHDLLTGLPNRSLLTERMSRVLERTLPREPAAVLLLDLDRFKEVNDALGHDVGDQLLRVVSGRLQHLDVPGGTVARLGGDEFAVFVPASNEPSRTTVGVATRIREALAAPVQLAQGTISTEASIGIAIAGEGQTHMDLLRHADTAMYAAKAAGLPWETYSPELDRGRAERLALLGDLRMALERDQLQLVYQPKLDLASGTITGVEALVRWHHPTRGLLRPDLFIPLAESTGLIDQLTGIVLTKALAQCRAWLDAGLDLSVAVNISARNVNNVDLPDQVTAALEAVDMSAARLVLEITESAVMGDPERTVPTLARLAATGVTLSLDDFGTGHSSLAYLHQLPVGELKIDRSFVMGLGREGRASGAVVDSVITLARALDLRVVAEGVESADVMERLRGLGCHVIQGYHTGRPAPVETVFDGTAATAKVRADAG